ncbi:hypothetical protein ABW19_dt0205942 [Dactylella cylindrospora]|nr:hypothetical protein ABW19_dt0205942 [Dactylella cylindrospora]
MVFDPVSLSISGAKILYKVGVQAYARTQEQAAENVLNALRVPGARLLSTGLVKREAIPGAAARIREVVDTGLKGKNLWGAKAGTNWIFRVLNQKGGEFYYEALAGYAFFEATQAERPDLGGSNGFDWGAGFITWVECVLGDDVLMSVWGEDTTPYFNVAGPLERAMEADGGANLWYTNLRRAKQYRDTLMPGYPSITAPLLMGSLGRYLPKSDIQELDETLRKVNAGKNSFRGKTAEARTALKLDLEFLSKKHQMITCDSKVLFTTLFLDRLGAGRGVIVYRQEDIRFMRWVAPKLGYTIVSVNSDIEAYTGWMTTSQGRCFSGWCIVYPTSLNPASESGTSSSSVTNNTASSSTGKGTSTKMFIAHTAFRTTTVDTVLTYEAGDIFLACDDHDVNYMTAGSTWRNGKTEACTTRKYVQKSHIFPVLNMDNPIEHSGQMNRICVAHHAYNTTQNDEMSFRKGQLFSGVYCKSKGWWLVSPGGKAADKHIPTNYIMLVDESNSTWKGEIDKKLLSNSFEYLKIGA